jgi:hypothetical protein
MVAATPLETIEQIAVRVGYPAWSITEWAKNNPDSAYSQLWREIQRLVIERDRLASAPDLLQENERLREALNAVMSDLRISKPKHSISAMTRHMVNKALAESALGRDQK